MTLKFQQNLFLLLQVLELDVMDIRIVEERSYTTSIEISPSTPDEFHIQRKHFLFFTDEKIYSLLMEICRTLGTDALCYTTSVCVKIILFSRAGGGSLTIRDMSIFLFLFLF